MFKNLIILPLLIVAVSGSFLNFEQNMEYNMSISVNTKFSIDGTKNYYEDELFKGTLLVQQKEDNKFYAQFFIIEPPVEPETFENLYKPFMVETNGSEILSITVPLNWTNLDISIAHSIIIQSIMGGNSNLTKRIESGNWKNETGVLQLFASGDLCESEISIIESADIVKFKAEINLARCEFPERKRQLIREKNISSDSISSIKMLYYITYERKNMTPKEMVYQTSVRKNIVAESYFEVIEYSKTVYQDAKEIQTKIQLQDNVKTLNKEQLLDFQYAILKNL